MTRVGPGMLKTAQLGDVAHDARSGCAVSRRIGSRVFAFFSVKNSKLRTLRELSIIRERTQQRPDVIA